MAKAATTAPTAQPEEDKKEALPPTAVSSKAQSSLPSLGGGRAGGLGGVGNRYGAFEYDQSYLNQAKAGLAKLNNGFGSMDIEAAAEGDKAEADGRSMLQVM